MNLFHRQKSPSSSKATAYICYILHSTNVNGYVVCGSHRSLFSRLWEVKMVPCGKIIVALRCLYWFSSSIYRSRAWFIRFTIVTFSSIQRITKCKYDSSLCNHLPKVFWYSSSINYTICTRALVLRLENSIVEGTSEAHSCDRNHFSDASVRLQFPLWGPFRGKKPANHNPSLACIAIIPWWWIIAIHVWLSGSSEASRKRECL